MSVRIFLSFLILSLAFAAPLWAETVVFKDFSVDVPAGWEHAEEGAMATLKAGDNSSILVLSPDKLPQGQSLAEFAAAFSEKYRGGQPVSKSRGTFQFDYVNDVGARAHVVIAQADETRPDIFLIVMVGEGNPDLSAILKSVNFTKY